MSVKVKCERCGSVLHDLMDCGVVRARSLAAPDCSVFVYRNRRGRGYTELAVKDGEPMMAHSVIREESGRVRSLRIWSHGQPKSTRIMCAIAEWRKQNAKLTDGGTQ